eukprot:CAMPEP_0113556146 /NCGR_PEP_ID=MMETSP0015_2-20120614/17100_1 /TAXON_ID=2838 /ORGANISM="Odontella" /LENGTH=101 /DNA_ID=CAMNT_0000457481 /DNA_START=252 /DNA_END=554 /DNA_ORIENTATION=- /assembly_acc=CAM_ASM_000160
MSSLFGKFADEILDAHEQVYNQVVKGASTLFSKDAGGSVLDYGSETASEMYGEDIDIDDLDDMQSPLEGIAESVMGGIFESHTGPQTSWEHIDAFRSAINW